MGWFQAIQRDGIGFVLDVQSEIFVLAFQDLVRPIVGSLQRLSD